MLYLYFLSLKFTKFCQSGMYFDFFLKKLSEIIVRNLYVYSAQFFGEKYIIETFTKKIFNNILFFINLTTGLTQLSFISFFFFIVLFIFVSIIFLNIFYFLL